MTQLQMKTEKELLITQPKQISQKTNQLISKTQIFIIHLDENENLFKPNIILSPKIKKKSQY